MRKSVVTMAALVVGLSGCANTGPIPTAEQDLPSTALNVEDHRSPFAGKILVTQRWDDEYKIDGEMVPRKIELGFDYNRNKSFKRIFDQDGTLLTETYAYDIPIGSTKQESLRAEYLVNNHPDLAGILKRDNVRTHSGFIYYDPQDSKCGDQSRCIWVFGYDEEANMLVLRSLVDLVSDSVAYPFFTPGNHVTKQKKVSHDE